MVNKLSSAEVKFEKNNYNMTSSPSPLKVHWGEKHGEYKLMRSRDTCFPAQIL